MKTLAALIALLMTVSSLALAAPAKKKSAKRPSRSLKQEMVFDGSNVDGMYHSTGEAVVKVEPEKQMNDLIGMRRDFKDRLTAEKQRLKRAEMVSESGLGEGALPAN